MACSLPGNYASLGTVALQTRPAGLAWSLPGKEINPHELGGEHCASRIRT